MTSAVSDEMLLALADGELEKATADALHARVMAEPELAERFALFVESRALLEDAGSSDQAVPPHLLAAIRAPPTEPGQVGMAWQ
ncbi:anti-sigma factor family protein [Bosea sp. 2RAB26]|uniref:anti-sigma factor family protein n=1 Tax=Bosea sp. 2RAB26 TaxID=3237476 RepID=UPI003F8DEA59